MLLVTVLVLALAFFGLDMDLSVVGKAVTIPPSYAQ